MVGTDFIEKKSTVKDVTVGPVVLDLTYNQQERLDALKRTELFAKVGEVLVTKYENGFLIYGGMAQLLSVDRPIKNNDFGHSVSAEMMTTGGTDVQKFDLTNNADIDLMVDDIGDVGLLAVQMQERLGESFKVMVANPDDYPRIDVTQNGVEVMSISDLKTSVKLVEEVNLELGIENGRTDLQTYMQAKLLKNDMDPIMVNRSGVGILMFSEREMPTDLIEINEASIYRPEVASILSELGRDELAQFTMREWAYNVGKVAVMTQFGMRMASEDQEKWRGEVVDNAEWASQSPDIMRTLSRRLVKAANGNFGWFKMAAINLGFLSWYSKDLDNELLDIYKTPDRWRRFVEDTGVMDKEMAAGTPHTVSDFVELIIADSGETKKAIVRSQFVDRWNPGDMSGVAFATGRKIKTV